LKGSGREKKAVVAAAKTRIKWLRETKSVYNRKLIYMNRIVPLMAQPKRKSNDSVHTTSFHKTKE
jgi:hypothetical protein